MLEISISRMKEPHRPESRPDACICDLLFISQIPKYLCCMVLVFVFESVLQKSETEKSLVKLFLNIAKRIKRQSLKVNREIKKVHLRYKLLLEIVS